MSSGILTSEDLDIVADVLNSESALFTDLVRTAGIDPTRDLQHMSLKQIVLQPGEDLSGFDFTGCDLSGAVFRRVDLSRATFDGALMHQTDLRGSRLPLVGLAAEQYELAQSGPLPAALSFGPNRLWPDSLVNPINDILKSADDDSALFQSAKRTYENHKPFLAEHLFKCLLDWRLKLNGPDSKRVITTQHFIALTKLDQGRTSEALAMSVRLLTEYKELGYDDGADDVAMLSLMWVAQMHLGRAAEAEVGLKKQLARLGESFSGVRFRTEVVKMQLHIAQALHYQGRLSEAEQALGKVVRDLQDAEIPNGSRYLKSCWRGIAVIALENNDVETAEAMLRKITTEDRPVSLARGLLLQGFLADLLGDSTVAESYLDDARKMLLPYYSSLPERRELEHYVSTRVPGARGGSVLWSLDISSQETG